jgi:hypothetical protein
MLEAAEERLPLLELGDSRGAARERLLEFLDLGHLTSSP